VRSKLFLTLVTAAVIAVGLAATQAWAHGGTAPVYRTSSHTCAEGATDTVDQAGHFSLSESGSTLSGSVDLTCVAKYARFTITLVQNHPCKTSIVGTLKTDGNGNGTMSFHTTAAPGTTQAFVLTSHDNHELASTPVAYSP